MKEEGPVIFPNDEVSIAVYKYCKERSVPLPDHLHKLANFTEENLPEVSEMMVSRLQAQYLIWTARSYGAKKILEIGCFCGFSALAFAEALKDVEGAKIVTTDINPKTCEIARNAFRDAGVDNIVTLIEGPAQETLLSLKEEGPFDLVFIDANKEGYPDYFKTLLDLKLIRKNGILIADNVLKRGLVADDSENNPSSGDKTEVWRASKLREFNLLASTDPRVESTILPVFDGLALVRVL
ncbi:hypothetical protein TWF730_010445 [Orbilia blumenaviensis]|uniref:Caffeoyl-CoA O-methyltransferase n=1 Tax=Orbilia blumenaviensis TaxID=1796055 RepID=A0AAV9UP35_9PEZI